MEYVNIQKNVGHSPRKVRLVADLVRKMSPVQAVEALRFVNKAAAIDVAKAIKTTLANAGTDELVFRTIEINEGLKMRRYRVGTAGRGRGRPYHKRTTHIKIVLTDEVMVKEDKKNLKNMKKAKEIKTEETKKEAVAEATN
jgi:large subunit ribosomal protein L22